MNGDAPLVCELLQYSNTVRQSHYQHLFMSHKYLSLNFRLEVGGAKLEFIKTDLFSVSNRLWLIFNRVTVSHCEPPSVEDGPYRSVSCV